MKDGITEREPQGARASTSSVGIAIPRAASIIAILTGCMVLVGWGLKIELFKSIVSGLVAMNPVTALAFILLGFSLWLSTSQPTNRRRHLAQACGSVVILSMCRGQRWGDIHQLFARLCSIFPHSAPVKPPVAKSFPGKYFTFNWLALPACPTLMQEDRDGHEQ